MYFTDDMIRQAFPKEPWPHQMRGLKDLLASLEKHDSVVLASPTGCHEIGHPILMHDGTIKNVEDVAVGDVVMGHDGGPRNVVRLCRGSEEMFRITPRRGVPFVVNGSHVMSLRHGLDRVGGIQYVTKNITLNEYMKQNKTFKHMSKLQQVGVDFQNQDPKWMVPPYHMGILIGKLGGKFVPHEYKTASRKARLEILAGLLDTDGCLSRGTGYDYISKSKRLSSDVVFLARSLGLRANISSSVKYSQFGSGGVYWRVSISGHTERIPCRIPRKQATPRRQKKDALVSGFDVTSVGVGDFYGFELDGDRMYLDGNFIRHHNSGKGLMQSALLNLLQSIGEGAVLYNVRKSLTDQTISRLEDDGIHFGVRSAAHKHLQNLPAKIQAASLQTDISRILRQNVWDAHECKLCLIDEAHLAMGGGAIKLMQKYLAEGTKIVGITGTPIGMSSAYKDIVVAGTNSELRACGAHVPAIMYSPHEMDTSKIKPVKTGEYREGDIIKNCWSQAVIGYIYEDFRRLNPDGALTMAAAPGIGESIWLSEMFLEKGHRVLHIDCNSVHINGEVYRNDNEGKVRQQALADFNKGEFDILCNCETIQQGVDIPSLGHLILARPYGSLANYIQVVGRVIRKSPATPERVTIQDAGGNFWRHGSPNEDRDWADLFYKDEKEIREERKRDHQEDKKQEPIVCGRCGMVRASGGRCPGCGMASEKTQRIIVQQSGELKEVTSRVYPKPKEKRVVSVEQKQWDSIYWASRNSKSRNPMTFNDAWRRYQAEYREPPPKDLKRMPKDIRDMARRIRDVEWRELW